MAEGVTKRFAASAVPAIDRLSARIEPGRVTGLVGPDGAGKTTLLRLLAGLLLPDEGRLTVCGADTATGSGRDPPTGELHAAAVRPVRGPVGAPEPEPVRRPARRGRAEREQAFDRLLAFTDLTPLHRSAGRQAVRRHEAEARAGLRLAPRPALAPARRAERRRRSDLAARAVADGLRARRQGIGVVWSTAYLDEAERCSRGAAAQRGPGALRRTAQELTARVEGRTLPGPGRGARPASGAGRGADSAPRCSTA